MDQLEQLAYIEGELRVEARYYRLTSLVSSRDHIANMMNLIEDGD